jgi:hypothetical protein
MFSTLDPHASQDPNNLFIVVEDNQPEQPSAESIISESNLINFQPNKIDNKQNADQYYDLVDIALGASPLGLDTEEKSLPDQGGGERIEVSHVTVNVEGENATICAEIGNYIWKFTVPLGVLHDLLVLGISWATLVTSFAIAYFPVQIFAKDCSTNPDINVMQDLAKQIFMGTLIARMVALPLIHRAMSKMAKCFGRQSSFEKIATIIESLENTSLLTTGALACIGLNPLIPQTAFANYTYIPASMVAALPITNLVYSLLYNLNHFRGAWQDYREQYSYRKAFILTFFESLFGAATLASLSGLIEQVIYDTMINAARDVNVPQDEMNEVLIICTAIFAALGAISVSHPTLWKGVNALSAGAGVFYAVYNMPVAVLACLYPKDFIPHNYAKGGWSLEAVPGAFALALTLSTTVSTYRGLTEIARKGRQALYKTDLLSTGYNAANSFCSFFAKKESNRELSEISPASQPLLEESVASIQELAPPKEEGYVAKVKKCFSYLFWKNEPHQLSDNPNLSLAAMPQSSGI